MKLLIITLSMALFTLSSHRFITPMQVSDATRIGAVPRLTTDAAGNPLLTWVEKEDDQKAIFYFARSTDGGKSFGEKVRVAAPATLSAHAEGMPKLAVKGDGTLFAVFEVPRPVPESRFAGDLLYVTSNDGGQSWSEPKAVHQDTSPGKSHSFSDITRLPNGEIGVVWLDEKLPGKEGRPVLFTQTKLGGGFTQAVLVDDNACQCCRTNVFVDAKQAIHLTYRDLVPGPKGGSGSGPASRDISHVVSTDGGKAFGKPNAVFTDNWQVNACPHAGPSVTQLGNDVLVTWFSGKENAIGLRLAKLGSDQLVSTVLSNRAKHPQVTTVGEHLVWVWDEAVRKPGQAADEAMPQYAQRIAFRSSPKGATSFLTPVDVSASYPAVLSTKNGFVLAYEQVKDGQNPVIMVQYVNAVK